MVGCDLIAPSGLSHHCHLLAANVREGLQMVGCDSIASACLSRHCHLLAANV